MSIGFPFGLLVTDIPPPVLILFTDRYTPPQCRDPSAVHLAVGKEMANAQLEQAFMLPAIVRKKRLARENRNRRILRLQVGKLSIFPRVIGNFVIGKA